MEDFGVEGSGSRPCVWEAQSRTLRLRRWFSVFRTEGLGFSGQGQAKPRPLLECSWVVRSRVIGTLNKAMTMYSLTYI